MTGAYNSLWTPVLLADGRSVSAITFAVDERRVQYKRDFEVGISDEYTDALNSGLKFLAGSGSEANFTMGD